MGGAMICDRLSNLCLLFTLKDFSACASSWDDKIKIQNCIDSIYRASVTNETYPYSLSQNVPVIQLWSAELKKHLK